MSKVRVVRFTGPGSFGGVGLLVSGALLVGGGLVGGGLVGCGGSTPATGGAEDASSVEKEEVDVEALFRRENEDLESFPVVAPDGSWSAEVMATAAPQVQAADGGVVVLKIPIGGESSVHCQVHSDAIDAGGMFQSLLAGARQKVELREVTPWAVTLHGHAPAAWVEAIYLADQNGQKAAGHLKTAVNSTPALPVFCFHDEPGFKQTFQRAASSLFDKLAPKAAQPEPQYVSVYAVDLSGTPVGFTKTSLTIDPDGRRRFLTVSLAMLPVAPDELRFQDDYAVEVLDKNGRVAQGKWVEVEAGEITLNVDLERGKGNAYRYEGTVQGKAISGEFRSKTAQGLAGRVAVADQLKTKLAAGKPFSLVEQEYSPGVDPTAPLDVSYAREQGDPERQVRHQAGDVKMTGTVDESGETSEFVMALGARELHGKRVFVQGKF